MISIKTGGWLRIMNYRKHLFYGEPGKHREIHVAVEIPKVLFGSELKQDELTVSSLIFRHGILVRRPGAGVFDRLEVPLSINLFIFTVVTALGETYIASIRFGKEYVHKPVTLGSVSIQFDDRIDSIMGVSYFSADVHLGDAFPEQFSYFCFTFA